MSDKLEKAIADIQKHFGEGSIMKMGDTQLQQVDVIPTGSLGLDLALGVGGIPRGRVTEIYGPEASGKTTLCQHIVGNVQKQELVAAYIDMEHALDPAYAEKCGVNVEELYISQPTTGEQALEIAERLVRSGEVAIVVIDSVAALVPRAELEGDMGDAPMGSQARLMSQALRKLSGVVRKSNTSLVFTNQLRNKIGVVFGSPETTSGGVALKYYSSIRIDLRRKESIKSGAEIIGNRVRARVVKNKVAPPFKTAEFEIMYNEGISRELDLMETALNLDVMEKRGAYYYYGEESMHGKDAVRETLRENTELRSEIESAIRDSLVVAAEEEGNDGESTGPEA